MILLYEWGVAELSSGHGPRSVGVTDQEQRATERMLEALTALPPGVPARGWVTVVSYSPSAGPYLRHESPVQASRDAFGAVHWAAIDGDD